MSRASMAKSVGSDHRWRLPARLALVWALAVAWPLWGCSTVGQPDAELVPAEAVTLPLPAVKYRVGVMPLSIDDEFQSYLSSANSKSDKTRFVFLPPPDVQEKLVQDLVGASDKLNAFERVEFFKPDTRLTEPDAMAKILGEGWARGFDIVALPVLRKQDCAYVGQNGAFIPNVFLWVVSPIISWWIADQTFASETTVEIRYFSTATRHPEPFDTTEITGKIERELDDFDQGFNLLNMFITPYGMSESAWDDVGKKLLPLSRQECLREALKFFSTVDGGLAGTIDQNREELRKTMVVICGTPATRFGPQFAQEDAQAMRRLLLGEFGEQAKIREWTVTSLEGPRATKSEFLAAVREAFGNLARTGDRGVLFLSMPGVREKSGAGFLLFADSDVADYARSGLALDDLAAELANSPAEITIVAAVHWNPVGGTPDSDSEGESTATEDAGNGEPPLMEPPVTEHWPELPPTVEPPIVTDPEPGSFEPPVLGPTDPIPPTTPTDGEPGSWTPDAAANPEAHPTIPGDGPPGTAPPAVEPPLVSGPPATTEPGPGDVVETPAPGPEDPPSGAGTSRFTGPAFGGFKVKLDTPWQRLAKLPNVQIFMATSDGTAALEIDQIPGSLFVAELIRHAKFGPALDANSDGWLSWDELTRAAAEGVFAASFQEGIPQTPILLGADDVKQRGFVKLDVPSGNGANGRGRDTRMPVPNTGR